MVRKDSLPIRLIGRLRSLFPDIDFVEFDPNENLEKEGRNPTIIDTIEGIDHVVLFTSIEKIKTQRIYSMHDYDLGYNLKLLKKLGYIDSVKIIGVPMKMKEADALKELSAAISNLS